jgi:dihydrofolate reductase
MLIGIGSSSQELDWLHAYGSGDEDYGYRTFLQTVDAIVMGRLTYEKVRSVERWPYDKPAFVLASQSVEILPELRKSVEWMSASRYILSSPPAPALEPS